MATYTVKQGDTLGAIAKRMGTSVDNLTGFRSGDANLIFPGETISVKNSPNSEALDRSNNIRSELGGNVAPASTLSDTPKTGGFDFTSLQTQLADTQKKKEDAFKKLEGFRSSRYDELTKDRELDGTRSEVSRLDDLITQKKNERDASIATIRKNPGASAATLTGEVAVATDKLNADINNLIGQRNAKAGDYNTALSEIDAIVGREAGDLENELGFYEGSEKEVNALIQSYQTAIMDQLRREEDRGFKLEDDMRGFEQALQLARLKESTSGGGTNYTILTDQFGRPTVAIDRSNPTNQVNLSGVNGSAPTAGNSNPALMQAQAQAKAKSNEPGIIGKSWNWLTGLFQ